VFENEGHGGGADGASADGDSHHPLDEACAGFGDTGFETGETSHELCLELENIGFDTSQPSLDLGVELDNIGFGGDGFDESLAERVGGRSSLLLGERSGFEAIDVGETVEEDLGGHARELIIRSADSELGPFVRAAGGWSRGGAGP
jgi:hypothetical protein